MNAKILTSSLMWSGLFSLVLLSCSGGNKTESPSQQNSGTGTASVSTASTEHKRAILAILNQVANNTASANTSGTSPSTGSRSFSLIPSAYAQTDRIACTNGGTYGLNVVSGAESVEVVGAETGGLQLRFNNYAVKVTYAGCRQTHLMTNCATPYQMDGLFSLTVNGEVNRSTASPNYNVTGRAVTQSECSGLRIDTANDLGQPRDMGLNLTNSIQGTSATNPSMRGIVCIDNIQYPIEPGHYGQLQQELCGNRG